ncbi:sulfotransferase [Leisingera thetidis]|uniref:sulfotransferase n=1 Tax=Leisingera thetidis TaxID=2930199 RepID=UPI0021F6C56A|nr:sulfotransferase [Leisingera thetidis]
MMHRSLMRSNPARHRWLAVTGAPRSGTSYFGEILALDRRVNSLIEPFNPDAGIPAVTERYMYGSDPAAMPAPDREILDRLFRYEFTLKTVHGKRDKLPETIFKTLFFGGNQLALMKARLNARAEYSLIKDPIAVFLSEALYRMREMDIFFLVRHPVSFVGSLKRLGWNFTVAPLTGKKDLCAAFLPELMDADPASLSWAEHAAYIWLAIGRQMEHLLAQGIPAIPVFHEQISTDPVAHYERIYRHLGLDWTPRTRNHVIATSTASGKAGARTGVVHDFFRDSSSIFQHSIAQLDAGEAATVARVTAPLLERWYTGAGTAELSETGRLLHMRNC